MVSAGVYPKIRLAVIGVGLIGGSLARALRAAGAVDEIVGCGRGRENLEQAVNERQAVPLMFDDFMKQGKPKCGALKKEQLQYLFGSMAAETGSVALIPLMHNGVEGVLAIGSHDPQRFHPGKDTEFLQRLGDLVSHALGRIRPLEQE